MERTPETPYQPKEARQARRIRDEAMSMLERASWHAPIAATFTLKQGLSAGTLGPDQTGPVFINPYRASRNLRHVLNVVNRKMFGHAATRHDRRLQIFSVFERSAEGRLHIHALIDRPDHVDWQKFRAILTAAWRSSHWGDREIDLQPKANAGWIRYMLKLRSKADFADSIDWENVFLPRDR